MEEGGEIPATCGHRCKKRSRKIVLKFKNVDKKMFDFLPKT